jgi:hypothetical protein
VRSSRPILPSLECERKNAHCFFGDASEAAECLATLLLDLGILLTGSMIRKLKSGQYRLYSRKKNPKTGKRRNLGTFSSLGKARAHERAVQFFKKG